MSHAGLNESRRRKKSRSNFFSAQQRVSHKDVTWVLPVQVESVKVVLFQESDHAVNELLPHAFVPGHFAVLLAALVPAADGQGNTQTGTRIFQVCGLRRRKVILQLDIGQAKVTYIPSIICLSKLFRNEQCGS